MGTKLFVRNLSWGVNNDMLAEAFAAFGTVTEAVVINDKETGRSRGFGFVTFETPEEAQAAIEGMNEKEIDGRMIYVTEAKPRD